MQEYAGYTLASSHLYTEPPHDTGGFFMGSHFLVTRIL